MDAILTGVVWTGSLSQDRLKLDTWMQYLQVLSGQVHYHSKLPDNGHVLLHIDIPNHQVYPLPLLITPVNCVLDCIYLVTFDLPEGEQEEKATLKAIHDTLNDVHAYSSCLSEELDLDAELYDMKTEVFLIGLQRLEKNRSSFAQRLKRMLERSSYSQLIVWSGNDPYWTNNGAKLNIHDNQALLSRIQQDCCPPPQLIHQSLAFYWNLLQRFKDSPFVLYEDIEAKRDDVMLGITESSSLKQFLEVLHCLGFICYRSLPDLAHSENVVVLQPQYLRQLFVQVQKRSKKCKWFTIADLLRTVGKHIKDKRKWFQVMCTSMGLVIERFIGNRLKHVFVMGLEQEFDSPENAQHSVDSLLVTYQPEDVEQMDCFLPSSFFPTFVTTFLKTLEKQHRRHMEPTAMKRHYLHVSVPDATQIHVVERDSFIEIGLQQFHVDSQPQREVQQLDKLQQSCEDARVAVFTSAECAAASLELNSHRLQYGFLCYCREVVHFSKFNQSDCTLECICFAGLPGSPQVRIAGTTPQQQIWFSKVDTQKVCSVLCIDIIGLLSCVYWHCCVFSHALQSFEILQCSLSA